MLQPKNLCKILDLPYGQYHNYVTQLRSKWKTLLRNEQGSKCSIHGWRGWTRLPGGVDRAAAVGVGWLLTKSRNRWLLWRDRLGRLKWFETGRVDVYVRRPANLGKAYQLVCNAFSFTGLITDVKVLEKVLSGLRFKGAHYVFETKQRLPRVTIDLFKKSNGIIVKVGDASHPTGVEVLATYPDWAERNEGLLREVLDALRGVTNGPEGEPDYVR